MYQSIRVFANGTTWWFANNPVVVNLLAPTDVESALLSKFVVWYQTQGTNYVTRVNYYYNGTVAIENVTVTKPSSTYVYS